MSGGDSGAQPVVQAVESAGPRVTVPWWVAVTVASLVFAGGGGLGSLATGTGRSEVERARTESEKARSDSQKLVAYQLGELTKKVDALGAKVEAAAGDRVTKADLREKLAEREAMWRETLGRLEDRVRALEAK